MASRNDTAAGPADDDLDDLFNLDDGSIDDIFKSVDTHSTRMPSAQSINGAVADLGIDEEVKVVKKRTPIARLDEKRLLSQAGIPKLRQLAKTRLRFKGKTHEFSDVTRLLNFYQLWLDELYPKAKFSDGLEMIEKVGHSKRIQVMRREWINESKSNYSDKPPELRGELQPDPKAGSTENVSRELNSANNKDASTKEVDEDPNSFFLPGDKNKNYAPLMHPEEDELDALLAEDAAMNLDEAMPITEAQKKAENDAFDEDEMEALRDMEMEF